jgi:hypothetical protein
MGRFMKNNKKRNISDALLSAANKSFSLGLAELREKQKADIAARKKRIRRPVVPWGTP